MVITEKQRKALSDRMKKEWANGKVPPMLGKRHSVETKRKMSESSKGINKGMSTWNKGLTKETHPQLARSIESRKKQSDKAKLRDPLSYIQLEETLQKKSILMINSGRKPPSPKGRISSRKGKTLVEFFGKEKAEELIERRQKTKAKKIECGELVIPSGKNHCRYGKKLSGETKRKISESTKDRIHSAETRKKMSESHMGRTYEEIYGKEKSLEVRKKLSKSLQGHHALSGEDHPCWNGGTSFLPYSPEFNERLKNKIRRRDRFRCQECYRHENELDRKLSIHHIDYDKSNNEQSNLVSLCVGCHMQTNFDQTEWSEYFTDRLMESGLLG